MRNFRSKISKKIPSHPLVLFVFPRLCIGVDPPHGVVEFCSKSGSCHFAEKAKLRLAAIKIVGVISTSRLWGGAHFIASAPGRRKPYKLHHCKKTWLKA